MAGGKAIEQNVESGKRSRVLNTQRGSSLCSATDD